MTKKEKIIISILCVIIALLLIGIATSFTERVVYYFDNRMDLRNFERISYSDFGSYSFIPLLTVENSAHVRFIGKIQHFDKEMRTEYLFEVIEWLNVKKGDTIGQKTTLSIYAEAYPQKWTTTRDRVEQIHNVGFIKGYEYVIAVQIPTPGGKPHMYDASEALCVNDFSESIFFYTKNEDLKKDGGITSDMTGKEMLARIKAIIQEKHAKLGEAGD